ncbi:MAG: DinB family protein [Acidobacteriota bacterium]
MHFPVDITSPTRTLLHTLLFCLLAPATFAAAQELTPPAPAPAASASSTAPRVGFVMPKENAVPAWHRYMYIQLKTFVLKSADRMGEENYSFKPTEAIRSYGQVLGHIADAQYGFCSIALGEKNPALKIEQTKSSKADLTAALKDAFSYCDRAYDGMTDATGAQTVKMFGTDAPRLGVLIVNTAHTTEHYGNLVTYMRLKNIVPPSSDQGSMARPPKQ